MRAAGVDLVFVLLLAGLACSAPPAHPSASAPAASTATASTPPASTPAASAPAGNAPAASTPAPSAPAARDPDQDIVDAYEYMLGHWLVTRQEALEFKNGFRWNEVIHRPPATAATPDPDLDTTLSEAWVYVDETSCTMIELPQITGRYYSVQFTDAWGEVVLNINERQNPHHPFGKFAMCLHGAPKTFPREVRRLDLLGRKARVRMRIQLGADPAEAFALQKQIKMNATGSPKPPKAPRMELTDKLPGAEALDRTEEILAADLDVAQGIADVQVVARAVSRAAADPAQRAHVEKVIRERAIPAFLAEVKKSNLEMSGWTRPRMIGNFGRDYLARSIADYSTPWLNSVREMTFLTAGALDGSVTYIQRFANTALPRMLAYYLWSVTAIDVQTRKVVPNPLKRYQLNKESPLKYDNDGSLTLAFSPTLPEGIPESNWLPTPAGKRYELTYRFFGPARALGLGQVAPPPLAKKSDQ